MTTKKKSAAAIRKKRSKKGPKSLFRKIITFLLGLFFFLGIGGCLAFTGYYFYLSDKLPKISTLKDYHPPVITTVYSDDNRKIAEFYKERRVIVPLSKIPKTLIQAFLAAEDARFYRHKGIDLISVIRAFFKNLEAGTIVQGGSTITQQVTKSFFLTPERSYHRKIKEAILAYRIDKVFSKDEILYLYLNQIYLGHGAYGVESAASNYFGKSANELNIAECATLAGLPQAPSKYDPFRFPERTKKRQIYVLNRMVEEGFITNIQATEAINTPLNIKPRKNWYIEEVPYYTEHVRRYIEKKYGAKALYEDGLRIYTAVNIDMQKIARAAIDKGLRALDKRQGYRGPIKHLLPEQIEEFSKKYQEEINQKPLQEGVIAKGVVIGVDDNKNAAIIRIGDSLGWLAKKDMKWARKPDPEIPYYNAQIRKVSRVLKIGDVILCKIKGLLPAEEDTDEDILWELQLEQTPKVQSALLCLEAGTGQVKVMMGGRDFSNSQFNRAIQSRRQPGSAFKPIIYSAAIDKGYTAASVIIDSPIIYEDTAHDFTWKPKNYEKKFYGPTLLRNALAHSRNVITIKILQDIGIDYAIEYARKLGITSPLSQDLSIALGSSGVSLLEIVNAYSVFDNTGYLIEPLFITKILDRNGDILEEAQAKREKVIERSTAYIMTSLLESVVKEGTGRRVRALNRPVAGKTGTTNDLHDAWFVGFTPRYITGVWVGFDERAPLGHGETGSRAASPIWLDFMKEILKDKPVRVFQAPDEIVFSKIDAKTGLLPIPESEKTIFECFKEGTVPTQFTQKPDSIIDKDHFFKGM